MSEYSTPNYRKPGGEQVFNGPVEIGNAASFTGWAPVRRLLWSAADAAAADADGILTATEQALVTAYHVPASQPPCARNVTVTGGYSGQTGAVVVTGTDNDGNAISESLTLNGTSTVVGSKAFKSVTQVALPARTHTIAKQTETIEITHAADGDAVTLTITVTDGDAFSTPLSVELLTVPAEMTDVTLTAAAIAEALNADEDFAAVYTASSALGVITVEKNTYAANDASLALDITGESTSALTHGASTNGTAGVPYDTAAVGFGDKLGLPMLIETGVCHLATYLNGSLEGTAPTFATSASALESNTIDLNSALDGHTVETLFVQR